jgi:hypothetical protein
MLGRRAFNAALLALVLPAAVCSADPPAATVRVLFLGNSITYVGNLPAVFASLCDASGHKCSVEMLVKGGAALRERVIDDSLGKCGKRENASLRWVYSDGMHPGSDLTLMMAMALHREIFGSYPPAVPITVRAPIYGASSGLTSESFASTQPVRPGTATSIDYDAATLQSVLGVLEARCPKT